MWSSSAARAGSDEASPKPHSLAGCPGVTFAGDSEASRAEAQEEMGPSVQDVEADLASEHSLEQLLIGVDVFVGHLEDVDQLDGRVVRRLAVSVHGGTSSESIEDRVGGLLKARNPSPRHRGSVRPASRRSRAAPSGSDGLFPSPYSPAGG